MDLYCLRVKREAAGKTFPFDRVYMARNGEHTVFKKMFRYALVLPVEASLTNMLLDHVEIEAGTSHTFNRDEEAKPPTADEWKELISSEDWVLAVPILAKYVAANMPRYLTAVGRYRDPDHKKTKKRRRHIFASPIDEPFPALTYLQTPEQNIRPVCIACPNFINHQNGHCKLGEDICYTSLALGVHNHFKEGLDTPAPTEIEPFEED